MTNVVHSLPYPTIDAGNLSFPNGSYDVDVTSLSGGTSIQISHKLENASFIQKLIELGKAKYGCLLAVPITGHRSLSLSDSPVQTVKWDLGIVGEPPIIRPIIVTTDFIDCELKEDDDVAGIWVGRKISLPKGARLARGKYLRSMSSFKSLLDPQKDDNLPLGCFVVYANENQGFRFRVDVATDLHEFLSQTNVDKALYRSIAVHMVSRCLSILQEQQGRENNHEKWNDHSNLKMLSELLAEKDLPHWSEDDFLPERVALELYPLIIPKIEAEE